MRLYRFLLAGLSVVLALAFLSGCGEETPSGPDDRESRTTETVDTGTGTETEKDTEKDTTADPGHESESGKESDTEKPHESESESDDRQTETDKDTETEDTRTDYEKYGPVLLAHEGFTDNQLTHALHMTVTSSTQHIDLSMRFLPVAGCSWMLYADYEGFEPYPLKSMALAYGDNKAYVVVYSPDKDRFTRYEIHIFRVTEYTYRLISNGSVYTEGVVDNATMLREPDINPALPGRHFQYWAVNGVRAELPMKLTQDTDFEAVYAYIDYTITLNADGGTVSPSSLTVHYGDTFELPVPTRKDYTFEGWYQGSTLVTGGVFEKQTNVELKAKWKLILTAGADLTWVYDANTKTLTLTGTGATNDFGSLSACPWYEFRTEIQHVVLDDRITRIGNLCFSGCSSLVDVNVPASLTSIGQSAFLGCSSLSGFDLKEGITAIGMQSFQGCTSLSTLTFPSTLTTIPESAFTGSGLTAVTLDSVVEIGVKAFMGCPDLKDVILGDTVRIIHEKAFAECGSLETVRVGKSLQILDVEAFARCPKLKAVYWNAIDCEDGKPQIKAFNKSSETDEGVNSVTLTIGPDATKIPAYLFYGGKTKLSSIAYDGQTQLASIGISAFESCRYLTSVTIPKTLSSIGNKAFFGTTALATVLWDAEQLGSGTTLSTMSMIFGYSETSGASTHVIIGKDVKVIPAYIFFYAQITSVTFEANSTCQTVEDYAFARNKGLSQVSLPGTLTAIDATAFSVIADDPTVTFDGTVAGLQAIWNGDDPAFTVTCTDGTWPA